MNFSRAGVAKNRSRTSTVRAAIGRRRPDRPKRGRPRRAISAAASPAAVRERIDSRDTEPIDGSASPRKPSERMSSMSSASLEVQWRATASASSSAGDARAVVGDADQRSARRRRWRSRRAIAPASSAFSTSSLTTLAGRSMTSPAAIWLIIVSESWRMGMAALYTDSMAADRFSGSDRRSGRSASTARHRHWRRERDGSLSSASRSHQPVADLPRTLAQLAVLRPGDMEAPCRSSCTWSVTGTSSPRRQQPFGQMPPAKRDALALHDGLDHQARNR